MGFEFEYLGGFKVKFKTTVECERGAADWLGVLMRKTKGEKSLGTVL
jgi:hypothetical protein